MLNRQDPPHYAMDIIGNIADIYGVAVKNVYAGKVIVSNRDITSSAGYYVVVETDSIDPITKNKLYVRYLHLRDEPSVKPGARINKGDLIGYTGNTGKVSPTPTANRPRDGTHLHVDVNNAGKTSGNTILSNEFINPQKFFSGTPFLGDI